MTRKGDPMSVSASDMVMSSGIKFELDDATLVALVAGMMVVGCLVNNGSVCNETISYADFVNAARAIVAEAKKTPKEGNP